MNEKRPNGSFDVLIRDALARTPVTEPPPGFAREVASVAADLPEAAEVEICATRVLVSVAALAAGACALLLGDSVTLRLVHLLARAPWPLLLTATAAVAAIKFAEIMQVTRLGRIGD